MKPQLTFAFTMFLSANTIAQVQKGSKEISCSFAYSSVSASTRTSEKGADLTTHNNPTRYLTTALRFGYFVSNPLELEPELHIFASSRALPITTFTLNLSYNFRIKESRFLPFALFGLGASNGLPYCTDQSEERHVYSAMNLGCGVKYFLNEHVALRGEYRLQKFVAFEASLKYSLPSLTTTELNHESLLFGLSMFF